METNQPQFNGDSLYRDFDGLQIPTHKVFGIDMKYKIRIVTSAISYLIGVTFLLLSPLNIIASESRILGYLFAAFVGAFFVFCGTYIFVPLHKILSEFKKPLPMIFSIAQTSLFVLSILITFFGFKTISFILALASSFLTISTLAYPNKILMRMYKINNSTGL